MTYFGIGTYDQSGESVYTMGLCGDKLVVGTSNRKVRLLVLVTLAIVSSPAMYMLPMT